MEEGWRNWPPGASAPTGWVRKTGVVRNRGRGKPLPYGDGRRLAGVQHGTSGTSSPTGVDRTRPCNRGRLIAAPTGGAKPFVSVRRRGGRPRPPADMVECRTNGPPGASAPTGWCKVVRFRRRGGRPRTWMKDEETGRRGRRPLRDGAKNGRGAETAGGASPSPTEMGVPGCGTCSGTSGTPAPTGWGEAVRFHRRGGRPRPPADMEEGWRDGPPGASAPTGVRPKRGANQREGQAPPLRKRGCLGAGRTAGRRGRRPLRDGAKNGRGAETAGGASPSPTETGGAWVRNVQRDVEDAVPYGC